MTVEHLISTKTKQHIVGGILFSVSVFLGALATTVMTMKIESKEQYRDMDQNEYEEDTDDEY